MDKLIYQLFILIYYDMFKMYLCIFSFSFFFFYSGVNNKQLSMFSVFFLVCCFFLLKKNQLQSPVLFLYNISGNLKWCVCVYVYSSLLRSFPLWPCSVGGFSFFLFIYIFFSLFIFFVHIDRLGRSIDRSFIRSVSSSCSSLFPFDDNNIAICTIE